MSVQKILLTVYVLSLLCSAIKRLCSCLNSVYLVNVCETYAWLFIPFDATTVGSIWVDIDSVASDTLIAWMVRNYTFSSSRARLRS